LVSLSEPHSLFRMPVSADRRVVGAGLAASRRDGPHGTLMKRLLVHTVDNRPIFR
jgi:hypothetical protein